jgi:hypothetical protein
MVSKCYSSSKASFYKIILINTIILIAINNQQIERNFIHKRLAVNHKSEYIYLFIYTDMIMIV